MNRTTYRTDREVRSNKPWFAARVSAPDWTDMRAIGRRVKRGTMGQDYIVSLVRAADVKWLDEMPGGMSGLGLFIPAGTPIYHLSAEEYAEFGFWTVE